jgi:pimeloyl-ACP methyl ester carboxylesterase
MFSILGPFVALVLVGGTPAYQPARGTVVEHLICPADPTQTYALYLPSTYVATRRWPLLIVFDPGGRGARAAEVFKEAGERFGWIIAASENSRNGPWEPTLRAVNAMWPALLGGYAVDERRIYTAGHSGGATVAWMIAQQTGQIAGVITSGQPNPGIELGKKPAFAWFGAAGHNDFNFIEVKSIDARLARAGGAHRVEFFDGGHQWPPTDVTMRAFGWMEILAMKEGRRPRDADLAGTILAADTARARALEDPGLLTEAWRSYESIAASYSGIVDVSDAERTRKAIEGDGRWKSSRKLEDHADNRERDQMDSVGRVLSRLAAGDPLTIPELRRQLNIDSLLKTARGDGYDAASAKRSLALVRVQLSTVVRDLGTSHDRRAEIIQKILDSMK